MPGSYPNVPVPSSVSAPALIDPHWEMKTDAGPSIRRSKYSRPCRRWTLEYLGQETPNMRRIRDFLFQQRLGVGEFAWLHPTAVDPVFLFPTTPVTAQWRHGLWTGMYAYITGSPNAFLNGYAWRVTYIDPITVTLDGTSGSGVQGAGWVQVWVPRARVIASEEGVFPSPATLIGPEQIALNDRRAGFYNLSVDIEELY